jgi:hypothetical protein
VQSKFIVLSDPVAGKEQAYNDWYDRQHLQDMLTVAGVVSAQRFAFVCKINEVPHWRYCALYTIESDNPAAVVENLLKTVASGAIYVSDAMDPNVYAAAYQPIGEEIRR